MQTQPIKPIMQADVPIESTGTLHARAAHEGRSTRRQWRRQAGLGWFSLALGLGSLLAPDAMTSVVGARRSRRARTTLTAVGVRELACGVGILTTSTPTRWVWARLAGDLVDLGLLGMALSSRKVDRKRRLGALVSVFSVAMIDAYTALGSSRHEEQGDEAVAEHRAIRTTKSITVRCSPEEAYRFWHDFEKLPRFMAHLESVSVRGRSSTWVARGPLGMKFEWEAELTVDRPNEYIAWQSRKGTRVPNEGSVTFSPAPGGRGTEIRVELRYQPPAGALGAVTAKLFGREPSQQLDGDLRRFKQLVETGEVVHSDASIHRGLHAARPPHNRVQERQMQS